MATRTIQRSSFDPKQNNTVRIEPASNGAPFPNTPNFGKLWTNWKVSDYDYFYTGFTTVENRDSVPNIPSWLEVSRSNQGEGVEDYTGYTTLIDKCFNTFSLVEEGTYRIKGQIVWENPTIGTDYADFYPSFCYWFTGAKDIPSVNDNPDGNGLYYGPIDDHDAWWDFIYPQNPQEQKDSLTALDNSLIVYYDTVVSIDKKLGGRMDFKFSPINNGDDLTNNSIIGDEYNYPQNSFVEITRISRNAKRSFIEYHLPLQY